MIRNFVILRVCYFFCLASTLICYSCDGEELLTTLEAKQYVIAHRGSYSFHGLPENSRAALREALSLDILGTEFDVRQTKDGVLVINHDDIYGGMEISKTEFKELSSYKLNNGETIPTLEDFFAIHQEIKSSKILFIDLKNCDVNTVVDLVKEYNIQDNVMYIVSKKVYCDRIVYMGLGNYILYLNGDLTPHEAKNEGYKGISYHESVFNTHPKWLQEAKDLGLTVCIWPINSIDKMKYYVSRGILISTDVPTLYKN